MKVKLLDPGFANYTGHFGSTGFVDGVSEDVSEAEAQRMGSIMRVEVVGTGANPSITQLMVDARNQNMADMGGTKTLAELDLEAKVAKRVAENERKKAESLGGAKTGAEQNGGVPVASPADLDWTFTAEDLKALVSKQGIAGLRTFAEPYGVKGRAVKGIIEDLMAAKQNNVQPEPEANDVLEPGDPVEPVVTPPVDDAVGANAPEGTEFLDEDDEPAATEANEPPASEAAEAPGTGEGFIDENEPAGSSELDELDDLEAELADLTQGQE